MKVNTHEDEEESTLVFILTEDNTNTIIEISSQ